MKTLKPRSQRLAQLNIQSKLTDAVLQEARTLVINSYKKYGGDDKAAKGADMVVDLKRKMRERFGRKSKKSS